MQEKRELIKKLQEALDIHQEKKDGKHYVYEKCAVGEEEYSRMSEIRHTEPVAPITVQTIAITQFIRYLKEEDTCDTRNCAAKVSALYHEYLADKVDLEKTELYRLASEYVVKISQTAKKSVERQMLMVLAIEDVLKLTEE